MNWRTIVLWLVLVAAFISFYQYFAVRDPGAPPPAFGWLPVLMVVFFFLFFAVLVLRQRSANRALVEGGSLLSAGRPSEALAKYELARRLMPRAPIVRHNLALANLYLWRVDNAVALLEGASSASRWGGQDTRALSLPVLALAQALLGKAEQTAQTLQRLDDRAQSTHFALLAQCILACRAGDWAKAEELLQRREVYQFGGFFRALSEVLASWAAQSLRGEKLRFNRVALYNEAGPDPVRKVWPQLADFAEKAV